MPNEAQPVRGGVSRLATAARGACYIEACVTKSDRVGKNPPVQPLNDVGNKRPSCRVSSQQGTLASVSCTAFGVDKLNLGEHSSGMPVITGLLSSRIITVLIFVKW